MKKIAADALDNVVHRIIQAFYLEQIRLFGSQAWGQPNEDSDIELLVVPDTSSEPGYRRSREVFRSQRGLRLPIEVEVEVRTRDKMICAPQQVPTSLEHQASDRQQSLYWWDKARLTRCRGDYLNFDIRLFKAE